jgi:phenylacetic acid degradation operon negative regulatory protein
MQQIERRPVHTQFLVFTLFGDCILPRGGVIWTSDLLYLLELLGVSERATRSALSRMKRKGWLISRKNGRRSQYSLTARGWSLLKQGEQRIFEPPFLEWDGLWHIVTYSVPEKVRDLRHSLRQSLAWLGHASLTPGTWISPHNRRFEVESVCKDLGIQKYVEIFSGMHIGHSSDQDLVSRCWDLPGLEAQFKDFIAKYQPEYDKYQTGGDKKLALNPEKCFVRRFWLIHDFQSFHLRDPNLPSVLLPPDWVGTVARELVANYHRVLSTYTNEFLDAVIKGDGFPPTDNSKDISVNSEG